VTVSYIAQALADEAAVVPLGEGVLVEFMDHANRTGATGSAANDDCHGATCR
jgi:hypothetical protein